MKLQNIGPRDKRYNHEYPGFTQVVVLMGDQVVGHFYGPQAKMLAGRLIREVKLETGEYYATGQPMPYKPADGQW